MPKHSKFTMPDGTEVSVTEYAAGENLPFQIVVGPDLICPTCGAPEVNPNKDRGENGYILIRGYKVHDGVKWRSQCLVCSGCYDKDWNLTPENHDPKKGWF